MFKDTSELDKAYLAGIIDGEGCISIHRSNPREKSQSPNYKASLLITQANKPFLDFLLDKWGVGSVYRKPTRDGWKPQGVYEIRGKMCMNLLEAIVPYLVIKKLQAEGAIELERSKDSANRQKLSEETLEYREWIKEKISELNQRVFPWE